MSPRRLFKALGLGVALLAATGAVSAAPTYTYCCARDCRLVPLSECSYGAGQTQAICWSNCW